MTVPCDRMSDHLTVKNVVNVLQELSAGDCYCLGIQLDIKTSKLRDLERGPVEMFKPRMIEIWLESDQQCGWETLASALDVLEKKVLAKTVRSKLRKRLSSGYESDSVASQGLNGTTDQRSSGRRLQDMRSGVF